MMIMVVVEGRPASPRARARARRDARRAAIQIEDGIGRADEALARSRRRSRFFVLSWRITSHHSMADRILVSRMHDAMCALSADDVRVDAHVLHPVQHPARGPVHRGAPVLLVQRTVLQCNVMEWNGM